MAQGKASGPQDTADAVNRMQQQAAEVTRAAATEALNGFQRLAELNLKTAGQALDVSSQQIRALIDAKDVQALTQLVTSLAKPSPEQFSAYANAVASISRDTGAALTQLVQSQVQQANDELSRTIQKLAQAAPGGADGATNFLQEAMKASTTAYNRMTEGARQFAEQASRAAGQK